MKIVIKRSYLLAIVLLVTMVSCHNDDEQATVSVQNFTVTMNENPANGQIIGMVQATGNGTLTYSITVQIPTGALSINSSTGELTVANAALFDFETNPIITATVSVAGSGAVNTATVTINLTNVNEISVQNFTASINENPTNGQSLGTVQATGDGTLTYSITAQTPTGALSINSSTGELTVANAASFDFETNPIIAATVSVAGASNTATVTINLTNVNEVVVQNFTTNINENPGNGQSLGTVQATGDGALTYSIATQTPTGALGINSSTGELTVANNASFNFETNPTITATIAVNNSGTIKNLIATITLTNVNEIGEYKFGGVIFWVNADGTEGLVCAITDQSSGIQWYNGVSLNTTALGKVIGTGQANTTAIINAQGMGSYAAKLCDDLTLNGFSDWFLPSIEELKEMRIQKSIIDATSVANFGTAIEATRYWSSTEYSESLHAAEAVSFTSSSATFLEFKSNNHRVRAIRDWTDF